MNVAADCGHDRGEVRREQAPAVADGDRLNPARLAQRDVTDEDGPDRERPYRVI